MNTACLDLEVNANENRLAFLALPAKRASEQVTGTEFDLFKAVRKILSQIITDACSKRTAADFNSARDEYFAKYVQVMKAMSRMVAAVVPSGVITRLSYESMSEIEADLRDKGLTFFGEALSHQALFTIWTLRKIAELRERIIASPEVGKKLKEQDSELVGSFVSHILFARFHMDCLLYSIDTERALSPEVLESVSGGLRAMVNAYAYIRQACGLRQERAEEEVISIEFDDEERELTALSMKDIQANAYPN
jgi:hypothetical protein